MNGKSKICLTLIGVIAAAAVLAAPKSFAYADAYKAEASEILPDSTQDDLPAEEPAEPISIENASIILNTAAFSYTGKEIKPGLITVKQDNKVLEKDKDYTVSYENNVKTGYMTAAVKITGIGDYTSEACKYFSIAPEVKEIAALSTSNDSVRVSWEEDENALAYQILYSTASDFSSNVHSTTVKGRDYVNLSNIPAAGERWYIKIRSFITDTGEVTGKRIGTYGQLRSIVVKDNIRSVTIPYCSYTYTGSQIKPTVKVKGTNGVLLKEGTDYTLAYSPNINVGSAAIAVIGKGKIQGTYIKNFIIKPKKNALTALYSDKKGTFTASWKADSTATGYQVMYSTDPDFKKDVHTYSSSRTTETFSRYAKAGKTYYVKVRSYLAANGTRYGNYSPVKKITAMSRDISVLRDRLANAINSYPGSWSVYVKNLRTDETVEVNSHRTYYAASLMKLYCMAATYDAIEKGRIAETATVQLYLRQMITVSSNDAFNQLLRIIGKTAVRDWIIKNGYSETAQFHGYSEGSYYYWTVIEANRSNYTSAADCAKFFESVYKGTCVSKTASQKMLNLLKAQQVKYKAPAAIPSWVQTANKTGEVANNTHDCMLVFLEGDPYIISVMSEIKGAGWSNAYHITDLSRITYNYFSLNK